MAAIDTQLDDLSPSQREVLQQYTSVTGQDAGDAIPLLQRSQWNTQIAITKFFDGEQPDPVAEAIASEQASRQEARRYENLQESLLDGAGSPFAQRARMVDRPDAAPRIVPRPEQQVFRQSPLLVTLMMTPLMILYRFLSFPFRVFARLFPFLPRLFGPSTSHASRRNGNTFGRRPLNPRDTMARFKREFEEAFGPHALPFVDGGYAHALDIAKRELKFLLVMLTSPEHDDTEAFIQDTLLAPEIAAFINEPTNNIILWAGNVLDPEAYQVSTALKCTKFPFSALITHTPKEGSTAMSVVARLPGPMPASTYIAKLTAAINNYSAPLQAARADRAARDFDRNIRVEQDSAYERSLAQDRERMRLRKEAQAAEANAEKKALQEAAAAERQAKHLQLWKCWRARRLEDEPDAADKDSVRIAIRLSDTTGRVTRRFRGGAPIEELYAFVECYDVRDQLAVSEPVDRVDDYEHTYGFQLVSPMPRQIYDVRAGGTIRDRVGRSGNLIVEQLGADEEE